MSPLKELLFCCHGNGVAQNKTKTTENYRNSNSRLLQFGVSLAMKICCGERNFRTFDVVKKVTFFLVNKLRK